MSTIFTVIYDEIWSWNKNWSLWQKPSQVRDCWFSFFFLFNCACVLTDVLCSRCATGPDSEHNEPTWASPREERNWMRLNGATSNARLSQRQLLGLWLVVVAFRFTPLRLHTTYNYRAHDCFPPRPAPHTTSLFTQTSAVAHSPPPTIIYYYYYYYFDIIFTFVNSYTD